MTQTWTSSLAVAVEEVIDGTFDVAPDPLRDGIVVWNSDGRLSAFNRTIVTLLDLPDDALSLGMGEQDVHTLQASHGDVRFLNGFRPEQLTGSMTVGSGSDRWQAVLRSGRHPAAQAGRAGNGRCGRLRKV